MSYEGIVAVEPGKRGGQPCIRGMRITVYDVLSYLVSGMTQEEILEAFPYLTREDIATGTYKPRSRRGGAASMNASRSSKASRVRGSPVLL